MPRRAGVLWIVVFVAAFLMATFGVSQLTSLAPRVLRGMVSLADVLVGAGYLAVTAVSTLILGKMIYSGERAAGRVKRRVKLFE